jgi:hypothetical protein
VVVVIRLKEDTQRIGCKRALGPRILVIPFGVRVVEVSKVGSRVGVEETRYTLRYAIVLRSQEDEMCIKG